MDDLDRDRSNRTSDPYVRRRATRDESVWTRTMVTISPRTARDINVRVLANRLWTMSPLVVNEHGMQAISQNGTQIASNVRRALNPPLMIWMSEPSRLRVIRTIDFAEQVVVRLAGSKLIRMRILVLDMATTSSMIESRTHHLGGGSAVARNLLEPNRRNYEPWERISQIQQQN